MLACRVVYQSDGPHPGGGRERVCTVVPAAGVSGDGDGGEDL